MEIVKEFESVCENCAWFEDLPSQTARVFEEVLFIREIISRRQEYNDKDSVLELLDLRLESILEDLKEECEDWSLSDKS